MRDLLLAAVMAVIGWWLLAANDVNDTSGAQFVVGCITIVIAAGFVWNYIQERTQP